jgi:hypothetical protein
MGVPVNVGDRVLVATNTAGTGTYDLGAVVGGYLTPALAGVASGSRVAYVVVDSQVSPTIFEIGEGTYTSAAVPTVSRTLIIRNNTGGTSAVSWSSGTKYLFLAPSASRFVMYDSDGVMYVSTYVAFAGGGSQSTTVVSPVTDRDTGLFFPGANRVALATNGSTRLEFNETGAALFNNSHGTSGQVLRTNGSTSAPTWASLTAANVGAVDKAGDVMSGALSVAGYMNVYGNAATERSVYFATGATTRFQAVVTNAAESGSDAGSNFALRAFSDAGASLGDVFEVTRSTRKTDFKINPSINGSEVIKASDFVTNASTTGSMTLPSGIIMKWGSGVTSSGAVNITFATAFPTAAYNIQLTITGGDSAQSLNALKIGTFTRTAFNAYSPPTSSYSFLWFAIGV